MMRKTLRTAVALSRRGRLGFVLAQGAAAISFKSPSGNIGDGVGCDDY
jgi:hypothetical protein